MHEYFGLLSFGESDLYGTTPPPPPHPPVCSVFVFEYDITGCEAFSFKTEQIVCLFVSLLNV